jgi:hypothetical protein
VGDAGGLQVGQPDTGFNSSHAILGLGRGFEGFHDAGGPVGVRLLNCPEEGPRGNVFGSKVAACRVGRPFLGHVGLNVRDWGLDVLGVVPKAGEVGKVCGEVSMTPGRGNAATGIVQGRGEDVGKDGCMRVVAPEDDVIVQTNVEADVDVILVTVSLHEVHVKRTHERLKGLGIVHIVHSMLGAMLHPAELMDKKGACSPVMRPIITPIHEGVLEL